MPKPTLDDEQIQFAMIRDRHPLRLMLSELRRHARLNVERRTQFEQRLADSIAAADARRNGLPDIDFTQDLPIMARRQEIAELVNDHQVVVICGETGSGKSTQLPKICLDAGFGVHGLIGHTQPRRIAARSIASRLSDELCSPLGEAVGYKIRFTDKTRPQSFIKLMTDGILLAETQTDRFLNEYQVLIIDEAHERSLNIDFLLGILARLLPQRPELKLIITSATIDAQRFAEHFAGPHGPAPILTVSGRGYPVEARYRPLLTDDADRDEPTAIVDAIRELSAIDQGDILVFLPTEHDIRETHKRLRADWIDRNDQGRTEILPLYARLSNEEQNRVYQPTPHRRIVLATNVAESSLTIPGIRYVIDTGTARISRYAARSKVQRLPIEPISRASADQRLGRCGRLADGVCIRLYSEADYAARAEFTTPEIQRTNLASVILRAQAFRLGRIEDFPFIDPPQTDAIHDGYRTLFEIGALNERRELTELGRQLSKLPVDPRIARVIFAAHERNCMAEVLIIAAALEIQDPRERPMERQQQADEAHAQFVDEQSDFLSYLKLWDFYHELKLKLSKSQLRKACLTNFLSPNRMFEWTEIHRQLLQLVAAVGMRCQRRKDESPSIHQALLTGFLSRIGYRSGDFEYTAAGGVKFHLWPGSGLFAEKPAWCLIGELVETRRRYGRTAAKIQPQWVEPLAEHLVKRRFDEPHWHRKSGRVMVWENVTLFGLPIVHRRRTPYGPIDQDAAHEIFVRDALAKRDVSCNDKFYQHNESVIEECSLLAAKSRSSQCLIDEYDLHQFYHQRLPSEVYDLQTLRNWLNRDPEHRQRLEMKVTDFVDHADEAQDADQFPDHVTWGSMTLPVCYEFTPGDVRDGATVAVPEDGLAQLAPEAIEWGVPGLLVEKVIALIRGLPKSLRRSLIPASETAKQVVQDLDFGKGDFLEKLAAQLSKIASEPISVDAFKIDQLPAHLRLNVRVLDPQGKTISESRNISELRTQRGRPTLVATHGEDELAWFRQRITAWDFEELPESVALDRNGIHVASFPSLLDQGDHVDMYLANSKEIALRNLRGGIRRLYAIHQRKAIRAQVNWLPRLNEVSIWAADLLGKEELHRQLVDLIADRAFFQNREKIPRTREDFEARLSNSAERIGIATQDVAKLIPAIFDAYLQARVALEKVTAASFHYACNDVAEQIAGLMSERFLLTAPWMWLSSYPRYLNGIVYRLQRLSTGSFEKDQATIREIAMYSQRCHQRRTELDQLGAVDSELVTFRWMIEEYRVSCYAQPLGTIIPVSIKRLDKQWTKVSHGN